jgi:TolA-binding protein
MAARRNRNSSMGSLVRLVLMLGMCAAAGVGAALFFGAGGPAGSAGASGAAVTAPASGRLDLAERARLEKEIQSLRREVDERDKRITDLEIQIKLMNEGSSGKP